MSGKGTNTCGVRGLLIAVLCFAAFSVPSFAVELSTGFDPAQWPGRMPVTDEIKALTGELRKAVAACDEARVYAVRNRIVERMGRYAGTPEEAPSYGTPIDPAVPELARVERLWRASFDRMRGRNAWDLASPKDAELQTGPRLRTASDSIRAYLQSYEAGLEPRAPFLAAATDGLGYLLGAQARNGVFGYPYNPNGGRLEKAAAEAVAKGRAKGISMVERGWIVEDLGDGGLNFDNGMCGITLLYAHRVTKEPRCLDAAKRAAEWAAARRLVANWNYNSFSGYLLARLYRVTGEARYLDEAKRIFTIGVLPGQMDNGRWFDQHNAKIQYHSVMVRALVEYYLALKAAQDPLQRKVRERTSLALDSLAAQITRYGVSNSHELLCLDALCLGLLAFGPREEWQRAAHVDVNYLCDHGLSQLEAHRLPMTETVASYLLYRQVTEGKGAAGEMELR